MKTLGFEIPRLGTRRTRLQMQCAERKAQRPQLRQLARLEVRFKKLQKQRADLLRENRRLQHRVDAHQQRAMVAEARLSALPAVHGEPDALTDEHKGWIRALHADGQSVNFIAGKMDLDLVTTAMVVEGLL